MRNIYLYLIIGLIISCNAQEQDPVLKDFSGDYLMLPSDSINIEEYELLGASLIRRKANYLTFKNRPLINYYDILDLSDKVVKHLVYIGQGPDEVVKLTHINSPDNDILAFYDLNRKTIKEIGLSNIFDFDSIKQETVITIETDDRITQMCKTQDYYIGCGIIKDARFILVDKNNNSVSYVGSYPKLDKFDNLNYIQKGALFSSSRLIPHPEKNLFAFFMNGLMEIFSINQEHNLELLFKKYYFPPDFSIPEETFGPIFKYNLSNIAGFHDVYANSDFIYVLYSDYSYLVEDPHECKYCLVYNWSGEPVKKIIFSQALKSITMVDNVLYGLSNDDKAYIYLYSLD